MGSSKRPHAHDSRYSAYTGGPDPLAPPVDLREALEQIGQDVMEGTSPRRALAELLRRGNKNMKGADRLAAEVNRKRRELLSRNNLDGTLQEIKKLLDEAVLAERKELARALDDDARFQALPEEFEDDPLGAMRFETSRYALWTLLVNATTHVAVGEIFAKQLQALLDEAAKHGVKLEGWRCVVRPRPNGTGSDPYYISPDGKRYRSRQEVRRVVALKLPHSL